MEHGKTRTPSPEVDRHSCSHLGTGSRYARHRLWPDCAGKRSRTRLWTEAKPESLSRAVRPKTVGQRPPVPRWEQLCLGQSPWFPCFSVSQKRLTPQNRAQKTRCCSVVLRNFFVYFVYFVVPSVVLQRMHVKDPIGVRVPVVRLFLGQVAGALPGLRELEFVYGREAAPRIRQGSRGIGNQAGTAE